MGKKLSPESEEFAVSATLPEDSSTLVADRPGSAPGVEEFWADLKDGRVRYLRAGSGPALVLVHGLLGYSFSWRFTMPALAPYATVYALDMLGAGFSDRAPQVDHCMHAAAERLLEFIEKVGVSSCDLLGTSHGGAVAMMAAAQSLGVESRVRIRRLVLVAPVNPYSAHGRRMAPFFGSRVGTGLFRFATAHMSFLFRYAHRRLYADRRNIPAGALAGYVAPLAIPGLFEHSLAIVRTWMPDLQELEAILPRLAGLRTLLVWGDKDAAVYASSAAALAKHFPNSKLVVFPGVGHLPYEECPEEFNRELIAFLREAPAAG